MKHLCIFCGSRANSDEHVWPKWLLRNIPQWPKDKREFKGLRTYKDGRVDGWHKTTPDLVTKNVCKGCNGGWMSNLEKTAQHILCPMINGEEATLTKKQQHTMALWTIKTGMVLDSMPAAKENIFYEEQDRFHFCKTLLPPGYLTFWLGHYSGTHWSVFTNQRILSTEGCVPQYRSYILTMAFGRLVIQLANTKLTPITDNFAVELPIKKGEWGIIEFGPPFHSLQWPPSGPSFDDSERQLQAFSERFGGY